MKYTIDLNGALQANRALNQLLAFAASDGVEKLKEEGLYTEIIQSYAYLSRQVHLIALELLNDTKGSED